jgi:hypothetical protein
MAPQLTVTKGLPFRSPDPWMARAKTSLPTPDSPSIRIGMEDRAARSAEPQDPAHVRAPGGEIPEGERAGGAALHPAHLVLERAEPECVLDRHPEPLGTDRLDDEIDRRPPAWR